ncbi:hypothetical protein CEXT_574261 [Caerostris extrusa]|uniref:Uncharacterized protein n=1 Tax=Caerostris extrusa TaxID=172846 RepID=A0AAV4PCX3_CAEEX|nr:hypothetical protein CEXT_574261 [Caerostris extrusa]
MRAKTIVIWTPLIIRKRFAICYRIAYGNKTAVLLTALTENEFSDKRHTNVKELSHISEENGEQLSHNCAANREKVIHICGANAERSTHISGEIGEQLSHICAADVEIAIADTADGKQMRRNYPTFLQKLCNNYPTFVQQMCGNK